MQSFLSKIILGQKCIQNDFEATKDCMGSFPDQICMVSDQHIPKLEQNCRGLSQSFL